jgi:P-type Cu2+ transporter
MTGTACFHCGLPVDPRHRYRVEIEGRSHAVCCPGCKAVAELIRDAGMANYYALREAPEPGVGRPADDAADWQAFDRDDMLEAFGAIDGDDAEASIYVGGMYCAACSWLIESTLLLQPGVEAADVDPVTHRVRVRWRRARTGLGRILAALSGLGYEPQPLAPETGTRPEVAEQRKALKRLLVASLGMMQAMMFAVGLYAGDFEGIARDMQLFLRLVSFIVTTPVVFYAARPFFAAAWRGLLRRRPGMDLPVAIAVGAAYAASVVSMLTGGEAVWFDSVTMFVFFLTLGRFLEMRARHRSIDKSAALSGVLPNTVTRIEQGADAVVPVSRLVRGDRVRVRPGEAIPADGTLLTGRTAVDEALLTGESRPQARAAGDSLVAGSVNLDGVIEMRVDRTGPDTALGTIRRLAERARYARPDFVQLADRVAGWLVVALLGIAALVGAWWSVADPGRAFVVTLSVLVVTCPCALALATPAAFSAAATRLAELHLLVTNGNAIEVLARATRVVFDKTGTLTVGAPSIVATTVLDPACSAADYEHIAAALEAASTHPIAAAFGGRDAGIEATDHRIAVGEGVAATVDGVRWRLGRREFVAPDDPASPCGDTAEDDPARVYLGAAGRLRAAFELADPLRADAADTLRRLRALVPVVSLASGDGEAAVARAAASLGIEDYRSRCTPDAKLAIIRHAQQRGDTVVMVGDGINDAPVLAGADASVALSDGALLAQTNADLIMLGPSLAPLVTAFGAARRTMRIVRQNLAWAIVYNVVAIPLAAAGCVPPWAAAAGMSASSLIVVLNALRLGRYGE